MQMFNILLSLTLNFICFFCLAKNSWKYEKIYLYQFGKINHLLYNFCLGSTSSDYFLEMQKCFTRDIWFFVKKKLGSLFLQSEYTKEWFLLNFIEFNWIWWLIKLYRKWCLFECFPIHLHDIYKVISNPTTKIDLITSFDATQKR